MYQCASEVGAALCLLYPMIGLLSFAVPLPLPDVLGLKHLGEIPFLVIPHVVSYTIAVVFVTLADLIFKISRLCLANSYGCSALETEPVSGRSVGFLVLVLYSVSLAWFQNEIANLVCQGGVLLLLVLFREAPNQDSKVLQRPNNRPTLRTLYSSFASTRVPSWLGCLRWLCPCFIHSHQSS